MNAAKANTQQQRDAATAKQSELRAQQQRDAERERELKAKEEERRKKEAEAAKRREAAAREIEEKLRLERERKRLERAKVGCARSWKTIKAQLSMLNSLKTKLAKHTRSRRLLRPQRPERRHWHRLPRPPCSARNASSAMQCSLTMTIRLPTLRPVARGRIARVPPRPLLADLPRSTPLPSLPKLG